MFPRGRRMPREKTNVATKSASTIPAPAITVPKHFKVTEPELAVLSRLVRVMRQGDNRGAYWLGPFIEWLLYLDTTSPELEYVNPGVALAYLQEIDTASCLLKDGSSFIKAVMRKYPGISFVSWTSAVRLVKGTRNWAQEMNPVDEEEQFYQLLRLWRKDHPEPANKIKRPAGHLGREESGD